MVVAKVLCLLGICVLVLAGALLPVRLMEADHEKAQRSRRLLALWSSFGGGVFLATCFNALLPAVRGKVSAALSCLGLSLQGPRWGLERGLCAHLLQVCGVQGRLRGVSTKEQGRGSLCPAKAAGRGCGSIRDGWIRVGMFPSGE